MPPSAPWWEPPCSGRATTSAALQFTDAFNACLVNAFDPALISLAAVAFLGARLETAAVVGTGAAMASVLIVLGDGDLPALTATDFGAGEVLMCAAILCWTACTVIGRSAPALPPISCTAWQAVITFRVTPPVAATAGGLTLPAYSQGWWTPAFIVLFPTVLSYLLWNHAPGTVEPARAGVFMNLITVFTAVLAFVAGDPVSASQVVGGALVLIGVVLTNAHVFRRKAPPGVRATGIRPVRELAGRPAR